MIQQNEYTPLIVTPVQDKKNPGRTIARINRVLALFERREDCPPPGVAVEVMITGIMFARNEKSFFDYKAPVRFIFISVVDHKKHVLVNHSGFQMQGTMCTTTAQVPATSNLGIIKPTTLPGRRPQYYDEWITPGRCGVGSVNNVNVGFSPKDVRQEPRPGQAWMQRDFFAEQSSGVRRILGVSDLAELEFGHLIVPIDEPIGDSLWH